MERELDFTPYIAGKIIAAHQSAERFKECDEKMRLANSYNPRLDKVTIRVEDQFGAVTLHEVNKRMIFGMWLVRRTTTQELIEAGEPEIARSIVKMFEVEPPLENKIVIPNPDLIGAEAEMGREKGTLR